MDKSTTDVDTSNTGEAAASLPDGSDIETADERQDASASSNDSADDASKGSNDKDAGDSDTNTTDKSDDDGLAKFAKSQGFDPDNLTEGERRALKIAHDNQREFHKKRQQDKGELRDTVTELQDPSTVISDGDSEILKEQKAMRAEMAQLKQYQRVNEFWNQNPEAKELEADMNRLVLEEKEKYGLESAIYLSRNLDRLYKLAKADRTDPETLKAAGRQEEREELRRKQEGSADTGSASSSTRTSSKIDQNWIDNVYDPSNVEHRNMLDAYLSKG